MEEKNILPINYNLTIKMKNYLFPINIDGKYGTCFFIKVKYNEIDTKYLCIRYNLISDEFIKSKGEIKINENIIIKLNEKRTILSFEKRCKLILIEEDDNIPNDIILLTDLPPSNYTYTDAVHFAYDYPYNEDDYGISFGKILKIDMYKIYHQFYTKYLLFISPICIIKYGILYVIGIQMEEPNIKQYPYMSYGFSLAYILNRVNIKFKDFNDYSLENIMIIKNKEKHKFLVEYTNNKNCSFYTFDQYRAGIYYLHFGLSKLYNHQTAKNFNNNFIRVRKPKYMKYLKKLYYFKNINQNLFSIFNDVELANNFNEIIFQNDYETLFDFSYFIAGYIYALNKYSKKVVCEFVNNGDLIYTRMKLSKEDLELLQNNINKIITFKNFLSQIYSLEHLSGKINAFIDHIKNYKFFISDSDKFDTNIYITHNFDNLWKASCFSFIDNSKIFNLFSFFRVKEVNINYRRKSASIKLETVGKCEIFEAEIGKKENENIEYNIEYSPENNIIRIYDSYFNNRH